MYTYIYICIYICIFINKCIHIYIYMYLQICANTHVNVTKRVLLHPTPSQSFYTVHLTHPSITILNLIYIWSHISWSIETIEPAKTDGELLKQPFTTLSLSSVAEGVEDEFFSVLVDRSTGDIGEDGNGRRELLQVDILKSQCIAKCTV